MYTSEIERYMKGVPGFLGVFAADSFPTRLPNQKGVYSLILNTDPSWREGKHWIALVLLPEQGRSLFFDSYQIPPQTLFEPIIHERLSDLLSNAHSIVIETSPFPIQANDSPLTVEGECGEYCIFVLYHLPKYLYKLSHLIYSEFVSSNPIFNAVKVKRFVYQ